MQTGDYTGDRKALHALGGALGDTGDKAKYALVKPAFQKVKDDSYAAEKFLADNGQPPRVPRHGRRGDRTARITFATSTPSTNTGTRRSTTFPPTRPTPRMRTDVDYSQFVKPDLGVGRIMADSVLDATLMLAQDLLPQGIPARRQVCRAGPGGLGEEGRALRRPSVESARRRRSRCVAQRTFLSRQ